MLTRRALAPALAVLAVLSLAACTPDPVAATPTPTALSQDEAYAQAEAAYSIYIAAENAVVIADSSTFEPVFAATTGRQNALERSALSLWHAENYTQSGQLVVLWVDHVSISDDRATVRLSVCLDATEVTLTDEAGVSRKANDAEGVAVWDVGVQESPSDGVWRIEATAVAEGSPPCEARS